MVLGIAEKMKLPGFGENAFGPGLHFKRDEDLYLRMVANIAFGDKPDGSEKVPAASAEEIKIFEKARRHLPPTIYDAEPLEDGGGAGMVAPGGICHESGRPLPGIPEGLQGRPIGQQVWQDGGHLHGEHGRPPKIP